MTSVSDRCHDLIGSAVPRGIFFFLSSRWSGIRKLVFCPCGDRRDYIWVACRMQWEDFTSIVFFRHFSVSPLVRKSLSRTDFD